MLYCTYYIHLPAKLDYLNMSERKFPLSVIFDFWLTIWFFSHFSQLWYILGRHAL